MPSKQAESGRRGVARVLAGLMRRHQGTLDPPRTLLQHARTAFSESLLQCGAVQVNVPCIAKGMELESHKEAQAAADGKRQAGWPDRENDLRQTLSRTESWYRPPDRLETTLAETTGAHAVQHVGAPR